ncbi:MAG: MarR family winged helix-turn-helix transcriptional regulator [Eubacteriales bacterium]|jgi:DNA-binding MarR family transcriptional regulator
MDRTAAMLNQVLVTAFNQITKIEHKALSQGVFQDLTISEIHTIEQIGRADSPTMSDIAARLSVTLGTLTTSVNRLVKKGYVQRIPSQVDRRITHLALTPRGKEADQFHQQFHREMIQVILDHTTPQEQLVLEKALEHVLQFFNEKYQIT